MAGTSRWDRPRAPRDFRWFVRLIGKTLIVIGLLMFGFVGYQLWGTGIEYARAQDQAENEFAELLARSSTSLAAPSTSTTTTAAATTAAASGDTTSSPSSTTSTPSTTSTTSTTSSTSTTTTLPPVTTVPSFDVASLGIEQGKAFARLQIPSIGHESFVVAGVTREDLQNGPGHYPQTPMPGQLGNSAIAGHRTTYGQPFFDVDQIAPGDDIVVTLPYGTFVYVARETLIVGPSDWEVIATTDPNVAMLTLTSCHPKYSASQRIIIHADLDLTRSAAPGQPVFNYGRDDPVGPPATLPGDDPLVTTTALPPTTALPATTAQPSPASTSAASTSTTTSTVPPTTSAPTADSLYAVTARGGASGGNGASGASGASTAEDAFAESWFNDSEAWPHVALWGGAAAAIVIGAYQLAKAFKNSWIGLAAAIAPFMVALYFFYQNVNRLLPAAL